MITRTKYQIRTDASKIILETIERLKSLHATLQHGDNFVEMSEGMDLIGENVNAIADELFVLQEGEED